jgi:uncharacterized protein (TIGR03581 family)
MVAELARQLQPQHVNQVFTGVGASRALLGQSHTLVNGLISPTGTPGMVKISTGPLSAQQPDGIVPIDTAIALLKDMGLNYAIIGHSERRQKGETDEVVANKVKAAVDAGITAIACIGETLAERDAGKTIEVVERQLKVRACILCVKQSSCMLLFR